MATKPPARSNNLPEAKFHSNVAKYVALSAQIKPLDSEKKKLSSDIKEYVSANGTIADQDKPLNKSIKIGAITVGVVIPTKNVVDHGKAAKVLEEKGILERCTTKIVDEQALLVCFQEGLISLEEINSFTTKEEQPPRISVSGA